MSRDDPQMSDYELAKHFGVDPEQAKKETEAQLNRTEDDLYTIQGRVCNIASSNGGNLTPVGRILCNTYVHVLKSLYDFSNTLNDTDRERLRTLLASHENMPANVIAASASFVKPQRR